MVGVGAVLGTSLAAFLAPNAAVYATCIISVAKIVLIRLMGERTTPKPSLIGTDYIVERVTSLKVENF